MLSPVLKEIGSGPPKIKSCNKILAQSKDQLYIFLLFLIFSTVVRFRGNDGEERGKSSLLRNQVCL
jgi:hypothetical protein